MPELPEVETIKRQLNRVVVGQTIKEVKVLRAKSFVGKNKDVIGRKIVKVDRTAKVMRVRLNGGKNLLIHLKMTGQLVYQKLKIKNQRLGKSTNYHDRVVGGHPTADWVKELPSLHTRVVLKLSKGVLFFNDMRVFGWIKVVSDNGMEKELKNFGPDVIGDKRVNKTYFYKVLQGSRRAVKLVITDQKKLAGVGNIYANDGLYCARVHPERQANTLTKKESSKLLLCLRKVLKKGIKFGGATASDDKFVQATGLGGKYQEHFLVYEQEGKRCRRRECKGIIQKIKLGGRGTYYCSRCQK